MKKRKKDSLPSLLKRRKPDRITKEGFTRIENVTPRSRMAINFSFTQNRKLQNLETLNCSSTFRKSFVARTPGDKTIIPYINLVQISFGSLLLLEITFSSPSFVKNPSWIEIQGKASS